MNTKIISNAHNALLASGMIVIAAILFFAISLLPTNAHAADTVTAQMQVGSQGNQVSNLQAFLATNPDIYPAGLITGYYGPLTKAAVEQFQAHYGISQVGRVGPVTMAKMNSLISSGSGLDLRAPTVFNFGTSNLSQTGSTVSFNTDSAAQARVYYSTVPIQMTEAQNAQMMPALNAGSVASTNWSTGQSLNLSGLQPNTQYYYTAVATDAAGNVTILPSNTFRTNP